MTADALDRHLREGPQPLHCAGCGARWTSPEGFILAGVVHLCGDCWRKVQPILHAGGVERTPELPMCPLCGQLTEYQGWSGVDTNSRWECRRCQKHIQIAPYKASTSQIEARGAVEPPPPEVHADLYQDCGHWKCNDVANRHPELRNVAVEPPAQEPSEQEIAKAAVAFWDELPDDTISGQKSLTDGFTAGVRWLLRRSASPSEQAACDHKFVDSNSCLKCGWMPPSAPHGADTPGQEP